MKRDRWQHPVFAEHITAEYYVKTEGRDRTVDGNLGNGGREPQDLGEWRDRKATTCK